jgi:hypothetical protein
MSAEHRYLRGDTKEINAPVHGSTVVEKGDLMVICKKDSTVTHSATLLATADHYAYPANLVTAAGSSHTAFAQQFAGVAMKGSKTGVTENVPIATAGVFRYPAKTAVAVYPGYVVCGTTVSADRLYSQQVNYKTDAGSSKLAVGICKEYDATGTNIDFNLITRFSGVSWYDLFLLGTQ